MSGAFVSGPLDSNTRANPTKALYGSGGGIVGVTSLNAQVGTLAVTGDASIGITAPGLGAIQVSTAGRPQAVGTLSCTSVSAGTGTFTGAVAILSGASVTGNLAAGTMSTAGITSTGGVTGAVFTNSSPNSAVPFNIAAPQAYNAGLSASLVTVLPAAVAGLSGFKTLRLTVSSLSIGYGAGGGNTYWWAITPAASTTDGDQNRIVGNAVKFMETQVNAGVTTYSFALDLAYTSATWPTAGLMFFINASAGGTLSMTGSISGVL